MQFTINYEELTPISYVIKTAKSSKSTVKYIKMISGKEDDATISVDIDLNELMTAVNDDLSLNPMRTCVFLLKSARNIKGALEHAKISYCIGNRAWPRAPGKMKQITM